MQAILIANPKGGSGKTTLSTNIAGYLASTGKHVMLLDMDRQQSASMWLSRRDSGLPIIWPMRGGEKDGKADVLVIDSPAGIRGKNLHRAMKLADKVVIPVAPSFFDIQASAEFIRELVDEKMVRKGKLSLGVVGMRMNPRTRVASTLEQFIKGLDLPVLAYLRETQAYVNAAFEGKSLFDLPPSLAERELEQWSYLRQWLDGMN